MTREERNVLVFVALGVMVGSWPAPAPRDGASADGGIPAFDLPAEAAAQEAPADSASAPPPDSARTGADESAKPVDLFPIDLNRAPATLLEELPGIGPAKARAIVELRERKGGFARVEELDEVKGIGPRTVERLRGWVTVGRVDGAREPERSHRGERATGDPAPRERDPDSGAARSGEEAAEVQR